MWKPSPPGCLDLPADRTIHGVVTLVPGAAFGPVTTQHHEICWVIQAPEDSWCTLDEERFALTANTLYVVRPGVRYEYAYGPRGGSVHAYLQFTFADPLGEWLAEERWPRWRQVAPEAALLTNLRQLLGALHLVEPARRSLGCSLLQIVLYGFLHEIDLDIGAPPSAWAPPVVRAVDRILGDLRARRPIPPAGELARLTGASADHLSRLFRTELGVNLTDFVTRARLEQAIDLMFGSDTSLEQIALECGFFDGAHFTKSFRRIMHCAPRDFRQHREASGRLRPLLQLNINHLHPLQSRNRDQASSPLSTAATMATFRQLAARLQRANAEPFLRLATGGGEQQPADIVNRRTAPLDRPGGWTDRNIFPSHLLPKQGFAAHGVAFTLAWSRRGLHAVRMGRCAEAVAALHIPAPTGASALYLLVAAGRSRGPFEEIGAVEVQGSGGRPIRRRLLLAGHYRVEDRAACVRPDDLVVQDWWRSYPVWASEDVQPCVLPSHEDPSAPRPALYVVEIAAPPGTTLERVSLSPEPAATAILAILAATFVVGEDGRQRPEARAGDVSGN